MNNNDNNNNNFKNNAKKLRYKKIGLLHFTPPIYTMFAHCPIEFKIEQCTLQALKLHTFFSHNITFFLWNDICSSCNRGQNDHFFNK